MRRGKFVVFGSTTGQTDQGWFCFTMTKEKKEREMSPLDRHHQPQIDEKKKKKKKTKFTGQSF